VTKLEFYVLIILRNYQVYIMF